jgi:hypothetical protein
MMQIIGLQMRNVTLILMGWSARWILDGIKHEFADTATVHRKGNVKLDCSRAPLDAWLCQQNDDVEAHLLDQTVSSGVVSMVGFVMNSGDGGWMMVRNRGRLRENGWAARH